MYIEKVYGNHSNYLEPKPTKDIFKQEYCITNLFRSAGV